MNVLEKDPVEPTANVEKLDKDKKEAATPSVVSEYLKNNFIIISV